MQILEATYQVNGRQLHVRGVEGGVEASVGDQPAWLFDFLVPEHDHVNLLKLAVQLYGPVPRGPYKGQPNCTGSERFDLVQLLRSFSTR